MKTHKFLVTVKTEKSRDSSYWSLLYALAVRKPDGSSVFVRKKKQPGLR